MRETHISIVVLLSDRVLKIRKPVRFDFADFSTLSARADDCRREVELNRRLAPDVYLGVADLNLDNETFDHAVVMRRLPDDRSLAQRVLSAPERTWKADLRAVARTLAEFHIRAHRSDEINAAASVAAVRERFRRDVAAAERFVGPVLEPRAHAAVLHSVERYLAGREPLFARRIDAGFVCDGHGDLQASDIYCLDDGPRILDCLEFDDRLRYADIAADVAFLAMDLERLGTAATEGTAVAATHFVGEYESAAGTRIPPSLLDLYVALRAYVRVKVACLRQEQGNASAAHEARGLLALAQSHLDRGRVRLLLVGGLPGSGKSTLAKALGEATGAIVLRSDKLRHAGGETSQVSSRPQAFRQGAYAPEHTQTVYDELIAAARHHLGLGESVVLDASWNDSSHRHQAEMLASDSASDLIALHCAAPASVREKRVAARLRSGTDSSEATVDVSREMARLGDPWPSATEIDTTGDPHTVRATALAVMGMTSID